MPAVKPARKLKRTERKASSRGITLFPGSSLFCAEVNKTHGHLYRVLIGTRESASLVEDFYTWLLKRGMEWPTAAKVKPAALTAGKRK